MHVGISDSKIDKPTTNRQTKKPQLYESILSKRKENILENSSYSKTTDIPSENHIYLVY